MSVAVDLESKLATVHGAAEPSAMVDACAAIGKPAELIAWSAAAEPLAADVHGAVPMPAAIARVRAGARAMRPGEAVTPPGMRTGGAMPARMRKYDGNAEGGSGSFSRTRAGGTDAVKVRTPDAVFSSGDSPLMSRLSGASNAVSRVLLGTKQEAVTLSIRGMTCAACVGAVERALVAVEGVREVSVSLMGKRGQARALPRIPPPSPALLCRSLSVGDLLWPSLAFSDLL